MLQEITAIRHYTVMNKVKMNTSKNTPYICHVCKSALKCYYYYAQHSKTKKHGENMRKMNDIGIVDVRMTKVCIDI